MNGRLADRVALVTGGGSGIGAATAGALAAEGARVVLVGRREDRLRSVAEELVPPAEVVPADLRDPAARGEVVRSVLDRCGRLDLLVHGAGVFEKRPIEATDDGFWSEVIDVNLGAVVALTREAWNPLSQAGGQVVLISSIAALRGFPGNAAYASSKGGMNALGEVLREEGRDRGIRVITVCPAQTDTGLWEGKAPERVRAAMMPAAGVGRLIADLVATDRGIDIEPVVIRPPHDPWAGTV